MGSLPFELVLVVPVVVVVVLAVVAVGVPELDVLADGEVDEPVDDFGPVDVGGVVPVPLQFDSGSMYC